MSENLNSLTLSSVDEPPSTSDLVPSTHNKSVQWADWELRDVMEYNYTPTPATKIVTDDSAQTEWKVPPIDDELPLINDLVQTTMDISSLASRSQSVTTCSTTLEDDDEKQAALSDLITHLEDTAALLKEYLIPAKPDIIDDFASFEQTNFLLKYLVVLVLFSQGISILLLTLFDHLNEGEKATGYEILTRSCGAILQILNMLLVLFATVVLSRQMLKYKVEGSFLAKTYFATVVTFAGLYFIIYRFQPDSWEFSSMDKMEESVAISQYIRMLYLSVSAATLCGAANIQPRSWYVTLMLCFQSLVNFVYFASILAQTIGNYHSYTVQVRRSSSVSRTGFKSS